MAAGVYVTVVPLVLLTSTILFALVERPCMDPDRFARLMRRGRGLGRLPQANRTMAIETTAIERSAAVVGEET